MSILVVDDEFEDRTLLSKILTAEGLEVRVADCGELAMASLAVNRPELILVDIRMPEMDGLEVCRRLKQRADSRDIPVIFLSGSVDLADRLEGFRLGAVDFVSKPFRREELLARVRTHLELAKLRAELEERVARRTAQLRETEGLFRTMADAAPAMIWISGPDGLCNFVSKGWLEFTGRSFEEESGDGWANGVHSEDRERCTSTYCASFEARRVFEIEYRLRRADGQYRWVLDRGVPRFSPSGVFSGYIGSCLDITDLKQTHERMVAAQKLESLGVMAAGVAHDFGNLLGAIMGSADLALSEMAPDALSRENVVKIAAVAAHGAEIVRMLLASVGPANGAIAFGPVDLGSEVEQLLPLLNLSISKRAVVRSHLPNNLPPVLGNAPQIHQVVLNLITNASDALGDQSGFITVSADKASVTGESGDRSLGLVDGEYVRLKVSDTGCGMTGETRARIFDPFFTTKSMGRGLGLAAVHGIVRSHGGAIAVESAPEAGTTFEVWLPCAGAAARSAAPAA
jgi:two-component system cell cycle sensor histidine kinase/response regulator CckA